MCLCLCVSWCVCVCVCVCACVCLGVCVGEWNPVVVPSKIYCNFLSLVECVCLDGLAVVCRRCDGTFTSSVLRAWLLRGWKPGVWLMACIAFLCPRRSRYPSINRDVLAFMLSFFGQLAGGTGTADARLASLFARCGRTLSLRDLLKWASRVRQFSHAPPATAVSYFLTEQVCSDGRDGRSLGHGMMLRALCWL